LTGLPVVVFSDEFLLRLQVGRGAADQTDAVARPMQFTRTDESRGTGPS